MWYGVCMPGRNLVKQYAQNSYYHIYNRGVDKQIIFKDDDDFTVFLGLLKRYLGDMVEKKPNRTNHPNFHRDIDLLAFCLMDNHFHLFIYQKENNLAITELMRSLTTAYSMYFNKKYERVGPVFQQRYRAVLTTTDSQLLHITRYIHLNPKLYKDYEWSSYPYYTNKKHASWVKPGAILELFDGDYTIFVSDYEAARDDLAYIKYDLANY